MVSVHDLAAYVLGALGSMTAMKLQKLVYYCQAWSLVWNEEPLFRDRIEAWASGPVVRSLYAAHRGNFRVSPPWRRGDPDAMREEQQDTVDRVLEFYGGRGAQWLSDLTHREMPWKRARGDLQPGQRSTNQITLASMHEYYSGLASSA